MLTAILLFLASVLGALSMVLMMPRPGCRRGILGALVAVGALGTFWIAAATQKDGGYLTQLTEGTPGLPSIAFVYYYVFSFIAIASAVRVITHKRPVYSALWFIMVVLASSGLLLVMSAEFIAFAMVIIYGGAILVTYMFVIMLASQNEPQHESDAPEYDRFAREPLWASCAGFLLLAVLLSIYFSPNDVQPNPAAAMKSDAVIIEDYLADRAINEENKHLASSPSTYNEEDGIQVSNVERVGLDLFESHPLATELAGVILLMSLIGAVVIAKMQVPNEDAVARGIDDPETPIDESNAEGVTA